MKYSRLLLIAAAGSLTLLTGCQTMPYKGQAHDVKRRPQEEGVIGIPLNFRDEDRAVAEQKMKSNCSGMAFKIVEEGEVAIGQETKSTGRETDRKSTEHKMGSFLGMPVMSGEAGGKNTESSQVVTSVKEWQISYRCVAAAGGGGNRKIR